MQPDMDWWTSFGNFLVAICKIPVLCVQYLNYDFCLHSFSDWREEELLQAGVYKWWGVGGGRLRLCVFRRSILSSDSGKVSILFSIKSSNCMRNKITLTSYPTGSRLCGRTRMGKCFTPTGSCVGFTRCWENVQTPWSWCSWMTVKTCSSIMCRAKSTSCIKLHLTTGLWRQVWALSRFLSCIQDFWPFLVDSLSGRLGCWYQSNSGWWEEFLLSVLVWPRVCPLWDSSQDHAIGGLQVQVSARVRVVLHLGCI